jgi:FlaA1/EpsC-like NDP-sugar epimerase
VGRHRSRLNRPGGGPGLRRRAPALDSRRLGAAAVTGTLGELEYVVAAHDVDEVVIAMPTAAGVLTRTVVEACRRTGVPSRSVPGLYELLDGGVSVSRLRQVEIADLLRRASVPIRPGTGLDLQDQVVLITSAGGSIGAELCRQVARAPVTSCCWTTARTPSSTR